LRSVITAFCLLILALAAVSTAAADTPQEIRLMPADTAPLPQSSGISVLLLDIPAATQHDPRARAYIVDRLAPGAVIHRRIRVQNNSAATQSVRIYTGAASIDKGAFIGASDPSVNDLTTWTSVDKPQLELAPGKGADVLATIDVPRDAAEGEQYAAVWAETRDTPAAGTTIIQASRAGIRIYLSVGAGNGTPPDFSVTSLTAARDAQGNPQITAMVTNTGGRALDITGDLTLSKGPGGLSAGPFPVQKVTTLAPGSTGSVVTTLATELPNGPWNAQMHLKSGLVEHDSAATITFPDTGPGTPVKPGNEADVPWVALAAVAAVLFILTAAALLWGLRRRNSAPHPTRNRANHRRSPARLE
jgi:hypothetical protein